jgi:hypothetical protein
MQPYKIYMKEQEILLDEDFKGLVARSTLVAGKLKDKVEKTLSGLNYERKETSHMIRTFLMMLKDKLKHTENVTDEDVQAAVYQLRQVGKLAAIAPLFLMPGGGTTTAVLYMLGKKFFNISILPKGLEGVFECVNIQATLGHLVEAEEQMI